MCFSKILRKLTEEAGTFYIQFLVIFVLMGHWKQEKLKKQMEQYFATVQTSWIERTTSKWNP